MACLVCPSRASEDLEKAVDHAFSRAMSDADRHDLVEPVVRRRSLEDWVGAKIVFGRIHSFPAIDTFQNVCWSAPNPLVGHAYHRAVVRLQHQPDVQLDLAVCANDLPVVAAFPDFPAQPFALKDTSWNNADPSH